LGKEERGEVKIGLCRTQGKLWHELFGDEAVARSGEELGAGTKGDEFSGSDGEEELSSIARGEVLGGVAERDVLGGGNDGGSR
jgi:hypothetical protein